MNGTIGAAAARAAITEARVRRLKHAGYLVVSMIRIPEKRFCSAEVYHDLRAGGNSQLQKPVSLCRRTVPGSSETEYDKLVSFCYTSLCPQCSDPAVSADCKGWKQ